MSEEIKKPIWRVGFYNTEQDWRDGKKTVKELYTFQEAVDMFHVKVTQHLGAVSITHPIDADTNNENT